MKKLLLTLITCLTISLVFAQEFKTEYSTPFKKGDEKEIYKIVFPSAYGFMTLHHLDNVMMDNTKAMTLTKYDQSMQAIESKTFNLPKLDLRASDLQEVIELENQLVFISTVMHKKLAKHQVNAQIYSEKDNVVSENKVLASFPIEGYSKSGFYQIAVSPDQTKIAIVANMPFAKKTKEKVNVWVYDNQLNLLWEQSETLVYASDRSYQENAFVKNSGEVVLNKTIDAFKKTRKSELLTFNGTTVETQDFSSAGFLPMEMKLIDVNGQPMLAGFFWNGKNSVIKINSKEGEDNDGAFLFDLNNNLLLGIHEWSDDIDAKDLKSLQVVDVKVSGDDIFMFGEKYLEDSEFRKNGNTITTDLDYFYIYGSSIIVNFDSKGTLKGFTPLFNSKKYKNTEKEKGSVSAVLLENGLNVFSNNNSHISFDAFFSNPNSTIEKPNLAIPENGSSFLPNVLPKTVRSVKDYGMIYYIANYGDRYYFCKMTW